MMLAGEQRAALDFRTQLLEQTDATRIFLLASGEGRAAFDVCTIADKIREAPDHELAAVGLRLRGLLFTALAVLAPSRGTC